MPNLLEALYEQQKVMIMQEKTKIREEIMKHMITHRNLLHALPPVSENDAAKRADYTRSLNLLRDYLG